MTSANTSQRTLEDGHILRDYDSDYIQLFRTTSDDPAEAISKQAADVIKLDESKARILHKLLSIGNAKLPTYRNGQRFQLTHPHQMSTAPTEVNTVIGTPDGGLTLTSLGDTIISLSHRTTKRLSSTLDEWGYTIDQSHIDHYGLGEMYPSNDGYVKPAVHQDYDRILEYVYNIDGLWDPEKHDFLYRA